MWKIPVMMGFNLQINILDNSVTIILFKSEMNLPTRFFNK